MRGTGFLLRCNQVVSGNGTVLLAVEIDAPEATGDGFKPSSRGGAQLHGRGAKGGIRARADGRCGGASCYCSPA